MQLVALIILAILLFGGGFAVNVLWYVAVGVLVIAGIGYVTGSRRSGV